MNFPGIKQHKEMYDRTHQVKESPIDLRGISSFTYKVRSFIENSNILNPSNCELRKFQDKGSLKETLEGIDIFDRVEKKDWMHRAGKPIRAAARGLLFVTGSSLVAPLGVIWNGALMAYHISKWAVSTKDTMQCKEHGEKIAAYAHSFFIDFGVSFFLLGANYIIAACILSAELGGFAMAAFMALAASYPAINLPGTVNRFVFEEHCGAAYAALKLKNNCGIVGRDGSVLKFDPILDEEKEIGEGLIQKMVDLGFDRFLDAVADLQYDLPSDSKLKDIDFPTADAIITFLEKNRSKIEAQTSSQWLNREIEILKQRYREFDELYDDYIAILKMRVEGNPIFNMLANRHVSTSHITKEHLYDQETFCEFLNQKAQSRPKNNFECNLESTRKFFAGKKPKTEKVPEFYIKVRANILNPNTQEAYQIFGFEKPPTSKADVKALRKNFTAIHPDKLPEHMWQEADEVFKCANAAYQMLLEKTPD